LVVELVNGTVPFSSRSLDFLLEIFGFSDQPSSTA
jgi:hypothetical protein